MLRHLDLGSRSWTQARTQDSGALGPGLQGEGGGVSMAGRGPGHPLWGSGRWASHGAPCGTRLPAILPGPRVGVGSSGRGRAGQAAVGRGVTLSPWQHGGPSASSHHSLEVRLDILRGYSHGAVCCHLSHDPKTKRLPNTGPTWISEHRPGPCIPGPSRGQQCDPVRPVSDVIVHQAEAHGPRCPRPQRPHSLLCGGIVVGHEAESVQHGAQLLQLLVCEHAQLVRPA